MLTILYTSARFDSLGGSARFAAPDHLSSAACAFVHFCCQVKQAGKSRPTLVYRSRPEVERELLEERTHKLNA
jgi:hypothetical protein